MSTAMTDHGADSIGNPNYVEETQERPANVDGRAFAAGMRLLAGGCAVIAARDGSLRAGLTATAVCPVSADPARLLICVNRAVHAHDVIHRAGLLSVNVLGAHQEDTARRFAGMVAAVRGGDKFVADAWHDGNDSFPFLEGALVSFGCRVAQALAGGNSHTVFICDVIDVRCSDGETARDPLLYFNRNFSTLKA